MAGQRQSGVLGPSMVGRGEELAGMERVWRAGGQMVLVRGAAGIGKSRLVREVGDRALAQGAVVLIGRCSPTATDVPFRPLREALLAASRAGRRPSASLGPFLPALGALVPDWIETAQGAASEATAIVVAEAVLRLMAEWSTVDAPVLLLIEDVHWADPETLNAIDYLAHNIGGSPPSVVLTQRDSERSAGTDLMDVLVRGRVAHRMDLGPLSREQTETMLRQHPNIDALARNLVDVVVERSDGVPFFVEELLETALNNSMSDSLVPTSIRTAIEARLGSFPEPTVQFLRYAALLGRHFDWHVVAAALRCAPEEAINLLRQAVSAQLVDPDGRAFRFRHALTVETIQASLLPEERRAASATLAGVLEELHPELDDGTCQLAAYMYFEAGDTRRAAELWLIAASRALGEGWLGTAENLAVRAWDARPNGSDRLLLSIWAASGQPLRALEAGHRILASGADETLRTDVRFDLVDAMIAAGRWSDAESYLATLQETSGLGASGEARRAVGQSEVAFGRNDSESALRFARTALAGARAAGNPELVCRAQWVIGRVERGRDIASARAAFEDAYACASENGLSIARIKSLQELGTIDMYETLAATRFDEARREAVAAGALSMVAMIDLQLAATYSARGQAELTLQSASRCEELSRRFGLASLPMSLALQAVAYGLSGDRKAMDAATASARAIGRDAHTVEAVTLANGAGLYHLAQGHASEAVAALDAAMEVVRSTPGGAYDFPGRWALLRTVLDDRGTEARDECRSLEYDTAMSRATLLMAEAVAAGRGRIDAQPIFAEADQALAAFESGFVRSLARLMVAPCAHADGWGEPAAWLREALANFEELDLPAFAGRSRSALRAMGEPVPRRTRMDTPRVPALLAAQGVTPREAEVLAQVASGLTNRQIGQALHLSVRTVEKHVEHLIMKTGHSRAELTQVAERAGIIATP